MYFKQNVRTRSHSFRCTYSTAERLQPFTPPELNYGGVLLLSIRQRYCIPTAAGFPPYFPSYEHHRACTSIS